MSTPSQQQTKTGQIRAFAWAPEGIFLEATQEAQYTSISRHEVGACELRQVLKTQTTSGSWKKINSEEIWIWGDYWNKDLELFLKGYFRTLFSMVNKRNQSKREKKERERKCELEHGFSNLNVCTDCMATSLKWGLWTLRLRWKMRT